MNNNKINLLPNSKHFNDDNETQKHTSAQTHKKDFLMHIPDEDEDNESDQTNAAKESNQSVNENEDTKQHTEETAEEIIESSQDKQTKTSFFNKLKNMFSRK